MSGISQPRVPGILRLNLGKSSLVLIGVLAAIAMIGYTMAQPIDTVEDIKPVLDADGTRTFNPVLTRPEPVSSGVREYTLIAQDKEHEVFPGVGMPGWTLNSTIPGPTITAIEGETVRIRFINNSPRPQTIHGHGVHQIQYDGIHEVVPPGGEYLYEWEADPVGLYLYHSHMMPIAKPVNQGFFGAYVVYPKEPLPAAKELLFILQFIDTDGDGDAAEFYAINAKADQFLNDPIQFGLDERVRIYLINMNIEFATFHIHGNFFKTYRSPIMWPDTTTEFTDVVGLGWGQRAILEFSYKYPGLWMFHDHIAEHAEEGLRGWFRVMQ